MLKRNLFFLFALFNSVLSYNYIRFNSKIYSLTIASNKAGTDFFSQFPLESTFSNDLGNYYIIGRSTNSYQSQLYQKKYTYLQGDIAVLKDNTYAIFKKTALYENESIYMGNIMNFDNILTNINTNTRTYETNMMKFFYSKELCSPSIIVINGEERIHVPMNKEEYKNNKNHYYYGIVNFATKGTEKLKKVPPIYLDNIYFGEDCSIEKDGFSLKCIIKDTKWYDVDAPKPVEYKVNELYEGCYGPIFTGITITVSGESLYINLSMLLIMMLYLV